MGNGASGGGVDIPADHVIETLGPKLAGFVKQFVNGEGVVPGGRVQKLRETIAKAQVEADEWWKNLDANRLGVGAEEAGKRPPSTKEEKMRAMFEWADKDWNGFLNRAEANKLQAVNNPNNLIDEATWNSLAGQLGFDPEKGFDFETAAKIWDDYEDDYRAIFGQRTKESASAQAYIADVQNAWRTMLLSKSVSWFTEAMQDDDKPKPDVPSHQVEDVQTDTAESFKKAAEDNLVKVVCDENTSNLAFAWLQRAIKTRHSHPDFKKVKLSVRTLLSSDAFWKGLGCTGNAWTRRGRLHDDDEWTDFVNLCKGELVKIGDAYKGFYVDQNLGEKIGHLGNDVKPSAPVRQVFPVCPNMELPGPGEPFLNDGKGENQYILHLHLLSQAFNGRFQTKVAKAVAASLSAGSSGVKHSPAPVKTMLRMMAKLRSDHMPNDAPRPGANIDTIRCGVSCATPEDLQRTYEAVLEEFGGKVVRVKNGYSPDFDPSISYHYRGLLMNIEWHTGVTYGEMMADPAVQLLWDLVAAHMRADKNATMSKLASKLKPMRVVDWFNDESVRDQEVVMISEVQLMLDHYMDMRQHTHLFYKVIREPTWVDLALDCLPDNVEVFPNRFSAGEHLQRFGNFLEALGGSDDEGDGGDGSDSD